MPVPHGRPARLPLICLLAALGTPPALADNHAVEVHTRPLGELLQPREYSAAASVVAREHSEISAEISARIEQLPPQPGDVVEAGALLTKLDCRSPARGLARARASERALEARRELATQQLARARRLVKSRSVTEELVDQRRAELRAAEAELAAQRAAAGEAQLNVQRCEIRAPYRAAVTARLAGVGSLAMPGQPLLRLQSLQSPEVAAQIPVAQAATLNGAKPQFELGGERFPLRLRSLSPLADPTTRSRAARFVANPGGDLPGPGHSGRLIWRGADRLPASLLSRRNGQLGLLLAKGDSAQFHPLPAAREGRPAAVDLPVDAEVITSGRHGLADGDPIRRATQ